MTRVAVLGTGSWGTAFSMVLADAGADVALWGRRAEVVRRRSTRATRTPTTCRASPLPESIARHRRRRPRRCDGAEVVVLAVPSQTLRGNLDRVDAAAAATAACWSA